MTIGPTALSSIDPNCQAAVFLSTPVSIPAATTAAVMMMMFSQSVPWSRAVLPFPRTRSRISSPASSASHAAMVSCTATLTTHSSAKVFRVLVLVPPASR